MLIRRLSSVGSVHLVAVLIIGFIRLSSSVDVIMSLDSKICTLQKKSDTLVINKFLKIVYGTIEVRQNSSMFFCFLTQLGGYHSISSGGGGGVF